ncbi:MAG TPA: lycopene cyclase domain-containing protein [Pseudonocardiaceae bacterium]|jgi:lycopene cyclase domain-containing protein|uniref:lycopene cyclase domain-containing protein n=1 Tax=Segeticoccus rhizosphaerae TaxID=1104777 RepID=UPI0010C02512|nr:MULTISPECIES: lycopene cyclase domain-containing protein [Intrasporangiaceae]HEX5405545.1 lycopene cyclase domain-containing protein [Pseudonocardiaceae bacterium]
MSYTALAVTAAAVAISVDRWLLRTRLTSSHTWWTACGVLLAFQLLTNAWLTGRGIVRYDKDVILGGARATWFGDGRVFYAPIEDLAFGFALILSSCAVWGWLGQHARRWGGSP